MTDAKHRQEKALNAGLEALAVKIQEEILVLQEDVKNEHQLELVQREERNEGQSILDAINRRIDQFESTQRELWEAIGSVEKEFNASEYDIWTERGRSLVEQSDFKRRLVKYYNCKSWG
jgi:2-oxo-4-hydroxy-4-carboxy--5-ureidoimidazoline (OHCU) decarboxylase